MKKLFVVSKFSVKLILPVVAAVMAMLVPASAQMTSTAGVRGGNWASANGNLQQVMYPDGITSSTTPAEATAIAKTIACDYKSVGINFVRFSINPATVSNSGSNPPWPVCQACINELVAEGLTVDLCCFYIDWQNSGTITNMSMWKSTWQTVDGVYGNNNSVYYEPINEPFGYTPLSSLESLYSTFLGYSLTKGQGYYILDGYGYAANVTGIGAWLAGKGYSCLMAVHDYAFWENYTTVPSWQTDIANRVSPYWHTTIMTEFGAETDNGLDYVTSTPTGSNVCFVQAMCSQCRTQGMGSVWFPAHQPSNNNKRMFNGPGEGVFNPSLILELQYGWSLDAIWSSSFDNPASGSGFTTAFAACSWGPMREDVFGVKSDGNIYHTWWFDGSGWNTWEEHQCPMAPTNGPAASANNGVAGREDIYYIGADGNIYHQYYNGSWQPSISTWDEINAPAGVKLVGTPTAASWGESRYDVYARGNNNTIYHIYSTDGVTWSGWGNQGGSTTNDVACESWGTNRLDAYALGTGSGAIWHQYWDGSWHPTGTSWAENTPEANCLYALGACSWATNRIDLFNVENSGTPVIGHIYYDFANTGGPGWIGDWTDDTLSPPKTPISAPCATSWGVNRLDVFVLGSDGKCYHAYWGF